MILYFCSSIPAVLKINGKYYARLSSDWVKFELDCELPFIEVCFLYSAQKSLCFFPDQDFLLSPPKDVIVTDLSGGLVIQFSPVVSNPTFKVLSQIKENDLVATVFNENGLKISIETPSSFFADCLPLTADNAAVSRFSLDGYDFIAVSFEGKEKTLFVYSLYPEVRCVFTRKVYSFSLDNGFFTTENFLDIAKHQVTSFWTFDGANFKEKDRKITCAKTVDPKKLPLAILPYAFLEELLVGGDVLPFVCGTVKENAQKLKEFLGEYIGVFPPPEFKDISLVGLIYNNGNNKYKAQYLTFEFTDNLISNVKKAD